MIARSPPCLSWCRALAVVAASLIGTAPAWPQVTPLVQSRGEAPQPKADGGGQNEPAPADNPGLIGEIGKLLRNPGLLLPPMPSLPSPNETVDNWSAGARDAVNSVQRAARSAIVTGRAVCPIADNGAPDCKSGSDKLCQSQGFSEGKSLGTDASHSCSVKRLLAGRKPKDACGTETYVTRALCQ